VIFLISTSWVTNVTVTSFIVWTSGIQLAKDYLLNIIAAILNL
jgi:hypothetical protein